MNAPFRPQAALAAMRAVRLIGAATPANAEAEIERLVRCFSAGRPRLPSWRYRGLDLGGVADDLGRLGEAARQLGRPLRSLYSARIDELRLEAAMAASVGRPAFGALCARRFHDTARAAREADALAAAWAGAARDDGERVRTDSDDPRSLLSVMRAAVGARRAPFSVRVAPSLGTLAATGERTVYVAAGRTLSERAARRTALHEVLGHVLPRLRAASGHPVFALGTARGTDDQEGLALVYEDRGGFLDAPRRSELAARHAAAAAMRAGADFVEVVRALEDRGVPLREALRTASRVFRGSDGRFPGLGRESVYLASFLRVRARLRAEPAAERVLCSGQVAVSALRALSQLGGKQASPEPPLTKATVWQT
jgi:hypothetical protein